MNIMIRNFVNLSLGGTQCMNYSVVVYTTKIKKNLSVLCLCGLIPGGIGGTSHCVFVSLFFP